MTLSWAALPVDECGSTALRLSSPVSRADFVITACGCETGPTAANAVSVLASMVVPSFLLALLTVLFVLRSMAPRGLMKVGISMLQIVSRCVHTRCMFFSRHAVSFFRLVSLSLTECHCLPCATVIAFVMANIITPCWSSGVSHCCLLPSDLSPCAVPIPSMKYPGRLTLPISSTSPKCF